MRTDQFALFAINLASAAWQWGGELEMCRICHFLPLNTSMRQFNFQAFYVSGAVHGREVVVHTAPNLFFLVHCSKNLSDWSCFYHWGHLGIFQQHKSRLPAATTRSVISWIINFLNLEVDFPLLSFNFQCWAYAWMYWDFFFLLKFAKS